MTLIKKYQFGKAKVEIHSNVTEEEERQNLIKLYDTINEIADEHRKQGINVDDWFYTQEQLDEIKKSGKYNFI